ncbi:MAG: 4-(cytidine 5'-diphospho)-2-C-methyl-D-erythritol kinase [Gammaproteobacteria bacterium]|nr:4-(cytidine 5'-diphospho)-2-C-methyl-D-erythritol kinase [Gammaproteobacteria bacterium]MDH5512861.1 4-(cytidine 5'-diphospho)-2-C-methyl-D-erythritol kinase [Gammaproteobacteria bacterium]
MRTWPAPAKLNLFLHITGRRPDGYHTLQTVFQFLDHADALTFDVTDDGLITRANPIGGISEDRDLTLRAARLLKASCGVTQGAQIRLTKRLPVGGGLGGGSSDAATTLLALNELWNTRMPIPELAALGLKLGADVPVFIHGHAAWAEGIGEILTPVEPAEAWYLVVVPPVHVSTARVFAEFELTRYSPTLTIRDFHEGRGLRNDLEAVVRNRYPEVDHAMRWLSGFGHPRMSGSGGCAFLDVPDAEQGRRLLERIPKPLTGFVARGLNRHPLSASASTVHPGA